MWPTEPAPVTLSVPSASAPALLAAVDHLREATSPPTAELDRLGLALARGAEVVVAPAPMLREVLLVAIDEAGQSLGERCTALLRGKGTGEGVRTQLVALDALLDLLDAAG